jgi:hypothetical protein
MKFQVRFIVKLLFFLLPIVAKADQPRTEFEHHSENRRFVFQLMINENKVCDYNYLEKNNWDLHECYWRVIDSLENKVLYNFQKGYGEWLIQNTVYVSNDGMNSISVNNWPAKGSNIDSNAIFLTFFSKNKELSSFKAKQILSNFKHILSTSSHYFWKNYSKITKNEFELELFDMTRFRFSLKDGSMLSKKRDSVLDSNTIRVVGKIMQANTNSVFSMQIFCVLFGQKPKSDIIKFKVSKKYIQRFKSLGKYSEDITICIRDGYYIKSEEWQEDSICPEKD